MRERGVPPTVHQTYSSVCVCRASKSVKSAESQTWENSENRVQQKKVWVKVHLQYKKCAKDSVWLRLYSSHGQPHSKPKQGTTHKEVEKREGKIWEREKEVVISKVLYGCNGRAVHTVTVTVCWPGWLAGWLATQPLTFPSSSSERFWKLKLKFFFLLFISWTVWSPHFNNNFNFNFGSLEATL